jgi:hypothetical protein
MGEVMRTPNAGNNPSTGGVHQVSDGDLAGDDVESLMVT